MPGVGSNAASWCDVKTPLQLSQSIIAALSVKLGQFTQLIEQGTQNHCLFGCKDLTEILCCWKQMITGDFQMVCLAKEGLSEIKGSIL